MNEERLEIINKEDNYDILIEARVNEVFIETYYKQYIRNSGLSNAELSLNLILLKEMQFVDLEVEKGDTKIKSRIFSKKIAEDEKNTTSKDEEYSDSLASGNTGIFIENKNNSDEYLIKIGNLEPGKTVFLQYHFIQNINSDDDFNYIYHLMGHFPFNESIFPKSVKAIINFETFYPITKLEPQLYRQNPKIYYKFKDDRKIEAEIIIKNAAFLNKYLISFVFQTKDYEIPKLFYQYDSINNETSFLLRNVEKKENKKTSPGSYYFLFYEDYYDLNIDYIKEFLKIFLPLLPEGSYFQIIGLGSYMKLYNTKPLKLNSTNFQKLINNINKENISNNNNNLHDMINIDEVFEFIYNSEENKDIPKFIFLLKIRYLQIFGFIINRKSKQYLDKLRIYEFQLDNSYMNIYSVQENTISSSHNFYDEESLKEILENQLKCMNNNYKDVKYEIINNNSKEILYDFKNDNYLIENQIKNYFFIMKGKIDRKIKINNIFKLNNNDCKTKLFFNDKNMINLNEGNILSKIIINKIIGNNENNSDINKLLFLSKKYQILCRYTSLYCEIENLEYLDRVSKPLNNQPVDISDRNNNNIQKIEGLFGNTDLALNAQIVSLFENNNNNDYHQCRKLFRNTSINNQQVFTSHENNDLILNTQRNSIFGNIINNNQNIGLFGNNYNNNQQDTSSLFGNNYNNNQQSASGLFGNNNNQQSTCGLFGNNNNNQESTSGLFGNNYNSNNQQNIGGLFGNNYNNNQQSTDGLLGNNNNNNQESTSVFIWK